MRSVEELESLDYQALRKLAKSKNIRQSGKGVTKKKLISLLWNSFRESSIPESLDSSQSSIMDSPDQLPLQEVPLESVLPIYSPKEEVFGGKKNLNIEVDLNDSNKENSSNRRLTFSILPSQPIVKTSEKTETAPSVNNKRSPHARKVVKKVTIAKTPTNAKRDDISTPKHVKIMKTPAAVRSSTSRPSTISHLKTPVKRMSESHGRTPGTTRTVALRLASSTKKKEMSKTQSKIPKLNANKLPNFANIHQTAFDKMASLLDVEQKRVLRKRQIESVNAFTAKMGIVPVTTQKKMLPKVVVKKTSLAKKSPSKNIAAKKSPGKKTLPKINPPKADSAKLVSEKGVRVFNATNVSQKVSLAKKANIKETAIQAAKKLKPAQLTGARDQNRTFLKGVRINKRFEMQMKNRGLM